VFTKDHHSILLSRSSVQFTAAHPDVRLRYTTSCVPCGCSRQISMQIFVRDFNLPHALVTSVNGSNHLMYVTIFPGVQNASDSYRLLLPVDPSIVVNRRSPTRAAAWRDKWPMIVRGRGPQFVINPETVS